LWTANESILKFVNENEDGSDSEKGSTRHNSNDLGTQPQGKRKRGRSAMTWGMRMRTINKEIEVIGKSWPELKTIVCKRWRKLIERSYAPHKEIKDIFTYITDPEHNIVQNYISNYNYTNNYLVKNCSYKNIYKYKYIYIYYIYIFIIYIYIVII